MLCVTDLTMLVWAALQNDRSVALLIWDYCSGPCLEP